MLEKPETKMSSLPLSRHPQTASFRLFKSFISPTVLLRGGPTFIKATVPLLLILI